MGQFNLPSSAGGQQHNQSYGIGLGAADAIAASAGAAQPASEELFSNAQPQHDDTEELFGMLLFSLRSDWATKSSCLAQRSPTVGFWCI